MTLADQLPKTAWFTFGQDHVHVVARQRFDKDTVVMITADDPREVMFKTFGEKWAMQYDTEPDMSFYPKGILTL
jgi:hypothetical protein